MFSLPNNLQTLSVVLVIIGAVLPDFIVAARFLLSCDNLHTNNKICIYTVSKWLNTKLIPTCLLIIQNLFLSERYSLFRGWSFTSLFVYKVLFKFISYIFITITICTECMLWMTPFFLVLERAIQYMYMKSVKCTKLWVNYCVWL